MADEAYELQKQAVLQRREGFIAGVGWACGRSHLEPAEAAAMRFPMPARLREALWHGVWYRWNDALGRFEVLLIDGWEFSQAANNSTYVMDSGFLSFLAELRANPIEATDG